MIYLIRVGSRDKNYQDLAKDLSIVEPPYWMTVRARHLSKSSEVKMIDAVVEKLNIDDLKTATFVEIFSSGNHPSAYIQELDGLITLQSGKVLWTTPEKIKIWKTMPTVFPDDSPWWEPLNMAKYKAHNWHVWGESKKDRTPYGIVCSSYGCPFTCKFCTLKNFYGRYVERDLDIVINEIKLLVEKYHIKEIKFLDEMFLLKSDRVSKLCDMIIDLGFDLNIWAYARLENLDFTLLPKLKRAGFTWLGIGIESGLQEIRQSNGKGNLTNKKIKEIITEIKNNGLHVAGDFIFGFFEDNFDTMKQTLDFAKELNCEYASFYSMIDYSNPTPPYSKYAQYSYDCHPVPTKYLTSTEVLKFRDNAFHDYFMSDEYLTMMSKTFGWSVVREVEEMTAIKLKRKLLEDE